MVKSSENEEVLKWVSEQPELLERLRRFQKMEGDLDAEAGSLDALECELLEVVKAIGAGQFARCIESKESAALERASSRTGGRIDSKKTGIHEFVGRDRSQRKGLAARHEEVSPVGRFAGVRAGGVSRSLQRLAVDFGAESFFAHASARLELHHRVSLCATTVRKITLTHAAAIAELETPTGGVSLRAAKGEAGIVSGIDGTMLSIVQTRGTRPGGGRKNRHCHWNIGEAAGGLAAFCQAKGHTPQGVRSNDKLLREFQKLLSKRGVTLEWSQTHRADYERAIRQ